MRSATFQAVDTLRGPGSDSTTGSRSGSALEEIVFLTIYCLW